MNVKMAVVISAGRVRGSVIDQYVRKAPQPSMRADSSSSRGRPRMNWTMRNTKKASVARNLGRTSGQ